MFESQRGRISGPDGFALPKDNILSTAPNIHVSTGAAGARPTGARDPARLKRAGNWLARLSVHASVEASVASRLPRELAVTKDQPRSSTIESKQHPCCPAPKRTAKSPS